LHGWFIYALNRNKNNNSDSDIDYKDNEGKIDNTNQVPTIVYYHANAGNMGHRLPIILKIDQNFECECVHIIISRIWGI